MVINKETRLFYSHKTRKALAEGYDYLPFGHAHYSYGSVCQKFLAAASSFGIEMREIRMPEVYADARDVPGSRADTVPIHIAFKPFHEIRLLKGALNIAHVAWEFDNLPDYETLPSQHARRDNVLNDYRRLLLTLDDVWVGSEYTKRVLLRYGIENVFVLPAPICFNRHGHARSECVDAIPEKVGYTQFTAREIGAASSEESKAGSAGDVLARIRACVRSGGKSFMSIVNPGDVRKNISSLLYAFQRFVSMSERPDLLIVKFVVDGTQTSLREAFTHHLRRNFSKLGIPISYMDCSQILVITSAIKSESLLQLYDAVDFYICSSGAEGQGLPMLEAMSRGVVPISSLETAMEDYVTQENGIIMTSHSEPIPLEVSAAYSTSGLFWRPVHYSEIIRSLWAATLLSKEDFAERSAQAMKTVEEGYSPSVVFGRMAERLDHLLEAGRGGI